MAFDKTTKNEWRQAFNADFLYAFILATFLLFNGLALSDYIYFNSSNHIGFFINLDEDSFDAVTEICSDPINEIYLIEDGINIDLIAELNDELINKKELIKSELNSDLIVNKNPIKSELIQNNKSNNDLKYTINKSLATTIPSQETTVKNQIIQSVQVNRSVTSEGYIYPAPTVTTPRSTNVGNTTKHSITITSHTNITTPQNKTFIKSEKNLGEKSIDLEKLPEVSFLLADLIKTADLQGKNIILSFGAKWCLPCKQMEKNVYNNLEVNGAIHKDYLFKKLDEKDLEAITLKNLYDVKVYPTTLIVDTKGNVISRYEEGLSKNRMMNILAENTYRPISNEAIAKVDSFSQPIELSAAIDFLVSRAENSTLDFD